MAAKALYEFIDEFQYEDLFDTDLRQGLEKTFRLVAMMYFEDCYNEDFSSVRQMINAAYYEMAKDKLYGINAKE